MDKKGKIQCEFVYYDWSLRDNVYTCKITNKTISEDSELEIIGEHLNGKTNQDVEAVNFWECSLSKVPQGLTKIYPSLKNLQIFRSGLKSIEQNDLKDYKNLQDICVDTNELRYLPGDLFAGMEKLEAIWLSGNKIEMIEPNLLDGLDKLKIVNFKRNSCIAKCFDSINNIGNATLEEIKNEIREKYLTSPWKKLYDAKKDLEKNFIATHHNGVCEDLQKIIQNENLKDFSVQVDDAEFKVHKFLLAARSPVLREMIENNIDAECLNLVDISKNIFTEILNFIYTDDLPKSDDINYLHLFIAAGRLKIQSLKNFAAEKLIEQANDENAFELLTLANKYESENLRQKSFKIIKNELNEYADEVTDDLATKPDKLKKILSIKREQEKIMLEMKLKLKAAFEED